MITSKERKIGLVLLLQLLFYCIQSLLLTFLFSGAGEKVLLAVSSITALVVFLLPTIIYMKLSGTKATTFLRPEIAFHRTRKPNNVVLMTAIGAVVTVSAVNVFGMISELLIGKSSVMAASQDPITLVLFFIRYVVLAAVLEELLFRGAVLDAFSGYSDAVRIVAAAIMFALMHYNLGQLLYAFVAGLVIAFFTCVCGSVVVAIVIHFVQNAISFVFSVLSTTLDKNVYQTVSLVSFWLFLALAIIGAVYVVISLKRENANPTTKPVTAKSLKNIAPEVVFYAILALVLSVLNF